MFDSSAAITSLDKSFDQNYDSAGVQVERHGTGSDYAPVTGCKFNFPDDPRSSDNGTGGAETNNSKEVSSEKVLVLKRSRSAFTGLFTSLNLLHGSIHEGKKFY